MGCAVTTGVGAVINTAAVQPGDSVVVIGAGGVGLSAIMAAEMRGADPIVLVDPAEGKRSMAMDVGATHSATPADARAVVHDLTRAGADHVLEAIGLVESVELAIDLMRPGGTTTLVGMTPMGDRASFDVYRFVEDGKRVLGSNYGSAVPARDFPRICSLYLDGGLPLDLLVTELIALDDLDEAFDAMRRGDGARRVVVHGGGSRDRFGGVHQRA